MFKSDGNIRTQHCFIACPPGQYCTCIQQDKNQINNMNKQVPFVGEVQQFNEVMGKEWQNRTTPTINKEDADFVFNFIKEENEELQTAIEEGDIVGVLDAILDITYVCLGNGAMAFGLKDKIIKGYAEVQASNLSKICKTEEEAIETVEIRSKEQNRPCYYKKVGDGFVVYRDDHKVMKARDYFKPNLTQFFTPEEIEN